MAEGVVSSLLEKLSAPLIQEAFLLCGVQDQVDWLLSEMQWMESFLKVADAKRRNGDELAKNWVREVRKVAHQAEDIIDIFMLEIHPRRRLQSRSGGPIMGRIIRYSAFPFELRARHKVGAGIKELRAKIEQIKASRERYSPVSLVDRTTITGEASRSPADEALQTRRRISPYYLDDNDDTVVVGLDVHKKAIIEQLLDAKNTRRCVISIVGPGGIGKTTLAKKVFNSNEIMTSFNTTRACVSVSQDYRVGELLKSIAKQVMGITSTDELMSMEIDDLKKTLYNFLKEKRYFIVLDDVWNMDVWLELTREVLPDVKNGSRVLVTTRSFDVADSSIPPYQLPFLSEEESWLLCLKKAFPAVNQDDHVDKPFAPELEDIGRRLMRKCGGLPLALVVLGGLLSRKDPNPATWMTVAERMDWASTQDGEYCLKILSLSYDDLPHHHLRSCFLYLAAFPEDFDIYVPELVQLWIAEGFIPWTETRTVEETAQAYLDELARRSMIQVTEFELGGIFCTCRIHDLFRDMCIREAREDGFLRVYNTTDSTDQDKMIRHDHTLRRLALHNISTNNTAKNLCLPSNLRSLLAFETDLNSSEIFHGLELLRVIHLDGFQGMEIFPEEMKSMIYLRYLSMGDCVSITKLPSFIGNLCNLVTLNAMSTKIRMLPKSVGKMEKMRHLLLPDTCECPPNIGNLTNLHTLYSPSARGGWIEQHGLEKLVNIQMLGVSELMATQAEVLLHSLHKFKRLSHLALYEAELISTGFLTGFSNHIHLHMLELDGPIPQRQLPPSGSYPPNLTKLELTNSKLEQDPMPTLEKLPNLMSLALANESYTGKEMVCITGGFPKLQYLVIGSLKELQDWRVEGGAMPQLTKLTILNCSRLTMLPDGLEHVTSLKYLQVYDEREEFRGRLQPGVGNDWYKIRHIRYVNVENID